MQELDGFEYIRKNKSTTVRKRRIRFFLILFTLAVLVTVFFRSSFNRVQSIEVVGNDYVSQDLILQTSGIRIGEDHYLGLPKSQITEILKSHISAIQNVEISKKFPGKITLHIQAYPAVAIEQIESKTWQLVLANGSNWPISGSISTAHLPILSGWGKDNLYRGSLCQALSEIDKKEIILVSEILPAPSQAYPDKILMYLKSPIEVYTTVSYLKDKLVHLDAYLANLKKQGISQGVITMLEVDSYAPFAKSD